MENFTDVKLEIFVPEADALKIFEALADIGVGRVGNYDHCFALHPVRGYFLPLPEANPFDGKIGELSETAEYKIEVNCKKELVNNALKVIREVHPYEEPVVNVIPLANHLFDMKSMSGL